jgi:hypothetical protein
MKYEKFTAPHYLRCTTCAKGKNRGTKRKWSCVINFHDDKVSTFGRSWLVFSAKLPKIVTFLLLLFYLRSTFVKNTKQKSGNEIINLKIRKWYLITKHGFIWSFTRFVLFFFCSGRFRKMLS